MNWSNVKLIFQREVRDQLRDRRTLFMIAVLPVLLYPLLGMSFFQITQFMREHASEVLVLGESSMPDLPPLIDGDKFDQSLFPNPRQWRLIHLEFDPSAPTRLSEEEVKQHARNLIQEDRYEVVVVFPPDFQQRLRDFRTGLLQRGANLPVAALDVPSPTIYYNTAKEKSQIAYSRVSSALQEWRTAIGKKNLEDIQAPATAIQPFTLEKTDVSEGTGRRDAAMWSKILPFVLLIWALTGAFYPAIDLCAGEKERGTLETLLCSPAQRSEIATGKLLTIMLFSMATSILNLLSMGVTGLFFVRQLASLGPMTESVGLPPLSAVVWLLVALIPISALFSALCLALAAFARSTKEGQYYLMPLVLVMMPLLILPMAPGVELNLGNSLIPVTGVVLLLRMLLEGATAQSLPFAAPVAAVTIVCCWLATRWAVDQFNTESVLFRESERLDMGLWLKHLVRDRGDTPTAGQALFCGVLILVIEFFMSLTIGMPSSYWGFIKTHLATQLAVIATPPLLMAIMLTRRPGRTLLLRGGPPLGTLLLSLLAAVLLAVALHPTVNFLRVQVERLYPLNLESLEQFGKLLEGASLWQAILLLAVLPAICEELAFRGFILSGLRHMGHKWGAIAISSLFFGLTHTILQQSLLASLVGAVIAYIAVQTGSLLPGILYHATHNCLGILSGNLAQDERFRWAIEPLEGHNFLYSWWITGLGLLIGIALLVWFSKLVYRKTDEETLQEALNRQPAAA